MAALKKNILWVAHESIISGANIAMLEYTKALKHEYNFHFILPHPGNLQEAISNAGFKSSVIYQYGWAVPQHTVKKPNLRIKVRSAIAILKTMALAKKTRADMIFTNTQIPFTGSVVASFLRMPHVWWLHEFGEEDFGFSPGFGNIQKAAVRMAKSKLIVCNSNAIKRKFEALLPYANITAIYQPVTFEHILQPEKKREACYIMLGQISASKGHMEVCRAMKSAKESSTAFKKSLHIKGPCEDEDYLNELRQFIAGNNLQHEINIEVGFFDREKILPNYKVLIVASKAEAFGRVIVEACKAGIKVMVKNSGGAPEIVRPQNGLLYNSCEMLSEFIANDAALPTGPNVEIYREAAEIAKLIKELKSIQ